MFIELKEFKRKHGHTRPSRRSGEFLTLRRWCLDQRKNRKAKKLSQDKIGLLNSIDFD